MGTNNSEHNNVLQDRWPAAKVKELNLRTDVEKIILYFQGKLPNTILSPALEEKIQRMKQCSELIRKHGGAKKVIPVLEELYDIGFAAASRLYQETQDAFGDITHFNRQYHIDTYVQMLIEGANQAKAQGDFRSYATMMREYKDAIKDFMGTNEADMYKQLQVPALELGFFPEELKVKIPANYKQRLERLKEAKRKDEIEDAIVLEPSNEEEGPL